MKVWTRILLAMLFALGAYAVGPSIVRAGECTDTDGDTICDEVDNCVAVGNLDQLDTDEDGAGDACDGCTEDPDKTEPGVCGCGIADDDSDEDGLLDCNDNCPLDANADQADADTDGVGDACDECAASVLGGTVTVEKCDSGIENQVLSNGCSLVDEVALCAADARTHGKFVSCIARGSKSWERDGVSLGRQRFRLIVCAAQSDIGRDDGTVARSGR